ncbi:TPA: FAD-dependent oxidoreductase [Streptococcus agalactiae]
MTEKYVNKVIVILGASFAGMTCAQKLRQLNPNWDIVLIDKEIHPDYVPNGLNWYYRHEISGLNQAMWQTEEEQRLQNIRCLFGLKVEKINKEDRELMLSDGSSVYYDQLICAMGSQAESTYIDGADAQGVLTTKTYATSQNAKQVLDKSHKVAVVGAGIIGLDIAYSLHESGKAVTLLEAQERPDFRHTDPDMSLPLLDAMAESKLHFFQNQKVEKITVTREEKLCLRTLTGDTFTVDAVILAVNFRPDSRLLTGLVDLSVDNSVVVNDYFQTSDPNIYAIGDLIWSYFKGLNSAYYMPLINQAIRSAQMLAYHLSGHAVPKLKITRATGSKHFGHYRANIGLTELEAGFYEDTVSVTYFPKEQYDLRIKLIANQKTGHLLGAQLISKENCLATANQLVQAISCDMTDFDLAFQDFIYTARESEMAYMLHQAAINLYEKRIGLCE